MPDSTDRRYRAEEKLRDYRKKTGPLPTVDSEMRRLIHELEVHQIELEMQKDELMQARAETEAALHQYTELYDFAPVGYFTLTRDGLILKINLAGANLLGMESAKLINRRLGLFVSVESRAVFSAFFDKLLSGVGKETCDLPFLKNGKGLFWGRTEATCFEDGQESRAVLWDITDRKRAEDELRHLSIHDSLTGLYNRDFFMEEMARFERGREFPVSIVMADVNHLKEINDQKGHAAGDALLKSVAQVLTAAFRTEDVIARIGGDEFAVLLPAADSVAAEVSLKRVQQVIRKNNAALNGTLISLSLGMSTTDKPMLLSNVLKEADANMYREKRGRDVP